MKHCFWNSCSFREAEASLSERGITRPSAVLRARSSGSHLRVTPPPADVDVGLRGSSSWDIAAALYELHINTFLQCCDDFLLCLLFCFDYSVAKNAI